MEKNLFMYETENLNVITYFQMELGFLLKYTVLPELLKRYTNVEILWDDFKAKITTKDGIYSGITIIITTDTLIVYKNNRKNNLYNVFMYFDGSLKTIRDNSICDSLAEYDWLVPKICMPIKDLVVKLEKNKLSKTYLLNKEIELETRFSKEEHRAWLVKLKRFAKEIHSIYGYEVIFKQFFYHTLDFYGFARVGTIEVFLNDDDNTIFTFDYNQEKNSVTIVSNNRQNLYKHKALLAVAKRLHTVKTYTAYDRKILKQECVDLGVKIEWN